MKQAPDNMSSGDFATPDGREIIVEDGVLDLTNLEQHTEEELMDYRKEVYEYAVENWTGIEHMNMHGYVMVLTMLNTELAVRKQAPTSN